MFNLFSKPKQQIILIILFAVLFWWLMSGGVVRALFILNDLQASPADFGFLVTLGIVVGLLFDIPTSVMADRYGRRPLLILASLLGVVGLVISALSQVYIVFVVASVCLAVRSALREGLLEAMLYDVIQAGGYKEKYHYIMSRYGIIALIGPTASMLLGGFLAGQLGVRAVFWLDLIPAFLLLCLALFIREPARHYEKSNLKPYKHMWHALGQIWQSPVLAYFFIFNFFLWTYALTFNSFSALYFIDLGFGPEILGLLASLNAGCVMLGHIIFRNYKTTPLLPVYLLLVTLLAAMLIRQPLVSACLFLVQAVLIGGLTAVFDREKQLVIPDHVRSTVGSAFGFSVQIAFIPLGLLFGFVANWSVAWAFVFVGGGALVLLAVTAIWHTRRLKQARLVVEK